MLSKPTCAFKSRGDLRSYINAIPRSASLACMFGAFVFLQFTTLGLANHAGEGYLATGQRDLVYYGLQVFVILGYLLHALYRRHFAGRRGVSALERGVFCLFFACVVLLCVCAMILCCM